MVCQLKPACLVLEKQLDQKLNVKRVELRTKRNLPTALANSKKGTELKKWFAGTTPVFLIVLKYHQKFTLCPNTATKSVKQQKFN